LDPKPRNLTSAKWQRSVTDAHLKKLIVWGGMSVGLAPTCPAQPDLHDKPEVVDALVAIIRGSGKQK
jgi:hypothetical protein